MILYRERLWAAPWLFISTALVMPASLIVFLPINVTAGIIIAIGLYALIVFSLIMSSPTITVTATEFTAGRASIERTFLGAVEAFDGHDATLERGQRLDARAWLMIRGWVSPVVKIDVLDPEDPAPYWLVSTRRPRELQRVLSGVTG